MMVFFVGVGRKDFGAVVLVDIDQRKEEANEEDRSDDSASKEGFCWRGGWGRRRWCV